MSVEDCDMILLVQADFDGELDAAQAASLAAHRAQCAICRASSEALRRARAAVRAGAPYHRASPALRRAVEARLAAATAAPRPRRRWWWREGLSFGVGAALAAMIALAVLPAQHDGLLAALVDDHVRALQPGHLTDVVSTDRHTVKPWFDGRIDFAPPVKDLAAQGFPLLGGRLDYLDGRAVAALAYSHGKHPIDLFVWAESGGDSAPAPAARSGYNVVHWRADGMAFWAVSDLEADGLADFVRDWRAAS